MSLASHLIAYRQQHGLTGSQLADYLGVNRVTVWRWEHKNHRVARRLQLSVAEKTAIPWWVLSKVGDVAPETDQ